MSADYFLDTNILVYLLDPSTLKQSISYQLVSSSIRNQNGIISIQVVQEYLNLATGKFAVKTTPENTREFLQRILLPLCQVYTNGELLADALDIQSEFRYSFYDSIILAATIQGNCAILYSEDMQSGQKVRGVEIINPYLPGARLPQ